MSLHFFQQRRDDHLMKRAVLSELILLRGDRYARQPSISPHRS